ncbi:glycosyltransferase family 32 protein [Treponema sp.]|uniref:glycosyltransferase family 32 protein n=1 Tax=Treponema sp. TaxID=166 RepID=UPI0025FAF2AC|nr:glycosyltransferase [Treponema sp.]MBR4320886.1 glycosyl transferase [Treponema sp.]
MIPKIIHYCWLGGKDFPIDVENCINSWKKNLPDYEFKLWSEKNFDINSNSWVSEAYKRKKYAFVSDYIRVWALYNYGGIYLDCDVEVIKSFNDLLKYKAFFGLECTLLPETAVIASEPNLEWVKVFMDYYNSHDFLDCNGKERSIANNILFPKIIEDYFKIDYFSYSFDIISNDLKIFPSEYFSPLNYLTKQKNITDNTYTIHKFNNSWAEQKRMNLKSFILNSLMLVLGKKRFAKIKYKKFVKYFI